MEKKLQKDTKIVWVLKAMLCSYIMTGIMLFILAMLLYKMDLSEEKVSAGIIAVYVLSTFVGGMVIGKLTKVKRFVWGLAIGAGYFILLTLISLGVYRTFQSDGTSLITTFILCAGGGMLGGMVS